MSENKLQPFGVEETSIEQKLGLGSVDLFGSGDASKSLDLSTGSSFIDNLKLPHAEVKPAKTPIEMLKELESSLTSNIANPASLNLEVALREKNIESKLKLLSLGSAIETLQTLDIRLNDPKPEIKPKSDEPPKSDSMTGPIKPIKADFDEFADSSLSDVANESSSSGGLFGMFGKKK